MGSKIAIIGTGYVGLTTGACLSHLGHTVVCADVVPEKVESLSRGEVPILEAGLDELVHEGIAQGRLSFVLGAQNAVTDAEFVFLCLPTPQGADGAADLSYIKAAATDIGPFLQADAVVINKSTVPVGSAGEVEKKLKRAVTDTESEVRFDVAAKPGVSNLLSILGAATGRTPEQAAVGYTQYGPLKADTAAAVIERLSPIQARFHELAADPAETQRLLAVGAAKATELAAATLSRAKTNLGLLPPG